MNDDALIIDHVDNGLIKLLRNFLTIRYIKFRQILLMKGHYCFIISNTQWKSLFVSLKLHLPYFSIKHELTFENTFQSCMYNKGSL